MNLHAGHLAPRFDVDTIRADFPALHQVVRGRPLTYLDNASTTHKPTAVLEAVERFYREDNSNVHRGVHALSERATQAFEGARRKLVRFLGAHTVREVVFTRGTTESLNLVAGTWGRANLRAGDEILVSWMEHHANLVPWQMLAQATGAVVRPIPIDDRGVLDLGALEEMLGAGRARLVAVAHASNALGTVNPVRTIADLAHAHGALVVVDGAQGAAHLRVDMAELGCDFYALSGHKMYGPTGIGVLWGRDELFQHMPPWQGGGDMIRSVSFEATTYAGPPHRFEAGTPNIAGAIGLARAAEYLEGLDRAAAEAHEAELLTHGTEVLEDLPGVRLIGTAPDKVGVLSFVVDGIHPHDLGTALDFEGVAVRAGHHCAQPVMDRFGLVATTRASIGLYTTHDELDRLGAALRVAIDLLG